MQSGVFFFVTLYFLFQYIKFFHSIRLETDIHRIHPFLAGNCHGWQPVQFKILPECFGKILDHQRLAPVAHHRFIRLNNVVCPREIIFFSIHALTSLKFSPQYAANIAYHARIFSRNVKQSFFIVEQIVRQQPKRPRSIGKVV